MNVLRSNTFFLELSLVILYMRTMCLCHIYPPSNPPRPSSPLPGSCSFVFLFSFSFVNAESHLILPLHTWVSGQPSTGAWATPQGPHGWRELISFYHQPLTTNSSLLGVGPQKPCSIHADVWVGLILCGSCSGSQSCSDSCRVQKTLSAAVPMTSALQSFCCSSVSFPEPLVCCRCPVYGSALSSHSFSALWPAVSLCINHHPNKECFPAEGQEMHSSVGRSLYLEGSSFSRRICDFSYRHLARYEFSSVQ